MVNAAKRLLPILWPIALLLFWPLSEHGFMAAKVAGLCLFALLAVIATRGKVHLPSLAFWLLFAWLLISGFWSTHPLDYFSAILPFALIITLYSVAETAAALQTATQIAGSICAVAVIVGSDLLGESFGGMGNPNFAAHFLLACLTLQQPQRWREQPIWAAMATLQTLAILFSGSRAGLLGLVVCACWFAPKKIQRGILISATVVAILLAIWWRTDLAQLYTYAQQPQQYVEAYRQQPHLLIERDPWFKGKRLSLMSRVIIYGNSAKAIRTAPLIGHGGGQFRVTYPAYSSSFAPDILLDGDYRVHAAHNLPLQLSLELGLIGLSLFLWGLIQLWRSADSTYRRLLAIQLMLSLVSVNYLNVAILALLALFAPRTQRQPPFPLIYPLLAWLCCLAWVACDHLKTQASQGFAPSWSQEWYPESQARLAYQKGEYKQAWQAQQRALAQDPHGPEIWVNLGHIARAISQIAQTPQERRRWQHEAESWYQKVRQTYPDVRFQQLE